LKIVSDPASQDYPARVVNVVTTLVAADSCSYNQFDGPKILAWHVEPVGTGVFPGSEESFKQRLPEHPVLAYHLVTGNGCALRISDFLSDRQFRSLGLYCDFYRAAEVNYQLAITGTCSRQRPNWGRAEPAWSRLLRRRPRPP
jgi:hypothetical protein